jgi:hypothetical protein
MWYTIFLIGLSVLLLVPYTIIVAITRNYPSIFVDTIISGYPSQSLEKIGILIDIYALACHLI